MFNAHQSVEIARDHLTNTSKLLSAQVGACSIAYTCSKFEALKLMMYAQCIALLHGQIMQKKDHVCTGNTCKQASSET